MEYTDIRYSDITTCIDSVSAEQHNWRTDGLQLNSCGGRAVRTTLKHEFIWRPSVLQLCCSGTHQINTRSNVTVPDVSVFHHKESIVFNWVLGLCKHETALPTQFHWRPSVLQLCCSGTHRINTSSMSLYLMSVYSITRSPNCVSIGCLIM